MSMKTKFSRVFIHLIVRHGVSLVVASPKEAASTLCAVVRTENGPMKSSEGGVQRRPVSQGRTTSKLALFVSKNQKLKVLGFMPIMAMLLTPAVVFAGVLA
jgi:hypothetical protein